MSYFRNLATLASQAVNTVLLAGHPDRTVSARAYLRGGWPERVINALFFWEPDHCRRSFARDETFARQTLNEYRSMSNG